VIRRCSASAAVIVLLSAGLPLAAQDSTARRLQVTLDEAVRRSIDVQPAMVQARGTTRSAGAGLRAATGAFLPSVSIGGSAARAGGSRLNNVTNQIVSAPTNSTYSGSLTLSLPIFDGFQRLADRNTASASQDAADAGLVNQRFQTTLNTKQIFYDALARAQLVRVAEAQVRRAQQQLQIAVEKLRAGSATRSDSLRSTVDYGNARIALLQAQANLATAEANLGRQVGVEGPVAAVPDSSIPAFPDTTGLVSSVITVAPAVKQAEAQARAAGAQVTSARASYWPTFNTTLSGSKSGDDWPWAAAGDPYLNSWSLRLGFSWTLFNGFARERQVTQAAVSRDNAQATAADERRRATASLTQQLAAVQTSFAQIDIARANLAAATEDLRVQQERYRVGAATILDLLTSQAALTTAEVNVVQVRFNYLIARAQLEALVGRTL
jgi:outer membrane protein TolC